MKVALCISGLPRSFKRTSESIYDNIINILKPDIFISTWDFKQTRDKQLQDGNLDEFYDFYEPKAFESEIWTDKTNEQFFNYSYFKNKYSRYIFNFPQSSGAMFYKIYKANLLKSSFESINNFKYDLVIRLRSDLLFKNKINLNEVDYAAQSDSIFLRTDTEHDASYSNRDWIYDQFAFGSSKSMDAYSNTFLNLDKIIINNPRLEPEIMLRENLKFENINYLKTDTRYEILR